MSCLTKLGDVHCSVACPVRRAAALAGRATEKPSNGFGSNASDRRVDPALSTLAFPSFRMFVTCVVPADFGRSLSRAAAEDGRSCANSAVEPVGLAVVALAAALLGRRFTFVSGR